MIRIKLNADSFCKYVKFPFYKNDKPVDSFSLTKSHFWGMTLFSAGSMRFRWNENNPNRNALLSEIANKNGKNDIVPVELIHSKIVYDVKNVSDTAGKTGDGIVTTNNSIMPVVTVADCMPLYLWDYETDCVGIVHSGWKGTGIVKEAIQLMNKNYGANPRNICVAIGAHIHNCCYIVNEERAVFFRQNFCDECVKPFLENEEKSVKSNLKWNNGGGKLFRLSLESANLSVLNNSGILYENIVILDECTCCNSLFGSNRRETACGNANFTVQAAFIL